MGYQAGDAARTQPIGCHARGDGDGRAKALYKPTLLVSVSGRAVDVLFDFLGVMQRMGDWRWVMETARCKLQMQDVRCKMQDEKRGGKSRGTRDRKWEMEIGDERRERKHMIQ